MSSFVNPDMFLSCSLLHSCVTYRSSSGEIYLFLNLHLYCNSIWEDEKLLKKIIYWKCWHMLVVPVMLWLSQENHHEFEASWYHILRPCLINKQSKPNLDLLYWSICFQFDTWWFLLCLQWPAVREISSSTFKLETFNRDLYDKFLNCLH